MKSALLRLVAIFFSVHSLFVPFYPLEGIELSRMPIIAKALLQNDVDFHRHKFQNVNALPVSNVIPRTVNVSALLTSKEPTATNVCQTRSATIRSSAARSAIVTHKDRKALQWFATLRPDNVCK